jgi:hypothetical protein
MIGDYSVFETLGDGNLYARRVVCLLQIGMTDLNSVCIGSFKFVFDPVQARSL